MAQDEEAVLSIVDQPLGEVLSERYLSYALSTIMGRSLPDVRDGMKPVHRRLLYAMAQLRLSSQSGPKKSARVVGDVIGKFHPHGDTAVYDAMVRLAQDFAVRYPLVDGQGNFGNIDGDNPAAMRYTEARLTKVAERMLEGIEEDAVDFRPTYDGDSHEPIVLPANFPNLLANGSTGIAVGMATNIPPHNVHELCTAMELMLDEDPSIEKLMDIVQGPDFPTGGVLVEPKESITETYITGKGAFRLRARWYKEDLKQGLYEIIVTEIPYQVQKSKLIERIAELIQTKKLPMLDDVRDESAEDIRLVLVPKNRNVQPELLMEALFRHTDLETRFNMNMNVLENGLVPRVMNLKEVLHSWLMHRQEVLVRRSAFRLDKVLNRLEVLDGYLIVYLNIDEVIRIIREEDDPKMQLMKTFSLTEMQADAVLNMRLRHLRRLEEMELRKEHDELSKERDQLQALLKSESKQWKEIRKQIGELKKDFGLDTPLGARRTEIGTEPKPIAVDALEEALIEKEPITVVCSKLGWIRGLKGHGHKTSDLKYKEGDKEQFVIECQTTDKLLIFGSNGRFYTIGCDKLPSGRGFGEPVRLMIDLPNDVNIVQTMVYEAEAVMIVASADSRGFMVKAQDVMAQTRSGKQVLNVSGTKAALCYRITDGDDQVAVIGTNRKMLIFPLNELPEMAKGKGVILQRYTDGSLSDVKTFKAEIGLSFRHGSGERILDEFQPWEGKRAQAGRMPPNGFPRDNKF